MRLVPFGHWGGERAGVATTVDPRGIGWAINIGEAFDIISPLSLRKCSLEEIVFDGNGPKIMQIKSKW